MSISEPTKGSATLSEPRGRSRVVLSAGALLLLTDVHHGYGAHVYQTPWRYHVLLLSIPAMLAILWSHRRLRQRPGDARARWILGLTTLVVPVLGIGAFEGFYNHLVKDLLYFLGASSALMNRLFPPPTYEMPNDAFFEITGIAQAILGAVTAWYLYRFGRGRGLPTTGGSGATRLGPRALIGRRQLTGIAGEVAQIPDAERLVHLHFRRFAGCPVCNLHLHSFARRHAEIEAAGIREIVVFHSSAEELLRVHARDLPFAVIADPDKHLYADFGVESARQASPSMRPRGGRLGLPADFLIGRDGRVIASKYGEHADDRWSVDEVLRMAENASTQLGPRSRRSLQQFPVDGRDAR